MICTNAGISLGIIPAPCTNTLVQMITIWHLFILLSATHMENSTEMSVTLKDHTHTHPYTNTHGRKIHSSLRLVIRQYLHLLDFKSLYWNSSYVSDMLWNTMAMPKDRTEISSTTMASIKFWTWGWVRRQTLLKCKEIQSMISHHLGFQSRYIHQWPISCPCPNANTVCSTI